MPETKLRSRLISACFMAYGLGNLLINIVTLYIRSAKSLVIFSFIVLFICLLPVFFYITRSPQFLFSKGRVSQLCETLVYVSKQNKTDLTQREFYEELIGESNFKMTDLEDCQIDVQIQPKNRKARSQLVKIMFNFLELLTTWK